MTNLIILRVGLGNREEKVCRKCYNSASDLVVLEVSIKLDLSVQRKSSEVYLISTEYLLQYLLQYFFFQLTGMHPHVDKHK